MCITLGSIDILAVLTLLIHEWGTFPFIVFLNFSQQCFKVFSVCTSLLPLFSLILLYCIKYFVLFDAIIIGITFVISFSDYLLCIDMQLIFVLTLYPTIAEFVLLTGIFSCGGFRVLSV